VIPALLAQDLRAEQFEIIVADSLSNDGTAEYLADVGRRAATCGTCPDHTAVALRRATPGSPPRAPLVLFTDADIIAAPDLLARHLARHARPGGPRAVVGLEVQVDSYDDYLRKSTHPSARNELHPRSRKTLIGSISDRQRVGAAQPSSTASDASTKISPATVTRISSWATGSSTPACRSNTSRAR
jgi:glycosyltransferase involved in cell wall biosynthesis